LHYFFAMQWLAFFAINVNEHFIQKMTCKCGHPALPLVYPATSRVDVIWKGGQLLVPSLCVRACYINITGLHRAAAMNDHIAETSLGTPAFSSFAAMQMRAAYCNHLFSRVYVPRTLVY
jgi:hypothetical protein